MNILQEFDTITAIATPLGTGGVGIIRISGEKAFAIAEKSFKGNLKSEKSATEKSLMRIMFWTKL